MKETIIFDNKTLSCNKGMEIDYIFQIMIIPAQTNLFHTTIRNKPDIDYEDYPNAQYLQPNEPYSTDLLNPKYMSISEEAAQSYAHDEDMVRLQYTTSRPIHLVDLYYPGHNLTSHEEGDRKAVYLSNKFKVHPNTFPVDGYFRIDDSGSKFSEVYLFRPWSCLYADYELLVNTPPVDEYYGEDDNEQLLLSVEMYKIMEILAFPIDPKYSYKVNSPDLILDDKVHYPEDWSDRSNLTINLVNSIKNTEIDLTTITHSLSGKFENVASGKVILFHENYQYTCYDKTLEFVNKFHKLKYAYLEILSRDEDVLTGDISKPIYAVVCINNNKYVGHIYAWLSKDESTILAMGIRSRVDYCLTSESNRVKSVSTLLLEGVRLLGLHLSCTSMSIAYPIGVMPMLLRKLEFTRTCIKQEDDCDMGDRASGSESILPITGYKKTIDVCLDERNLKFSVYKQ